MRLLERRPAIAGGRLDLGLEIPKQDRLRRAVAQDLVQGGVDDQAGIGLAAPQVGIPYCLLVMDDGKRGARALINPVITSRSGSVVDEEGCLSLPGIFADVERSKSITVQATDEDGRPFDLEASGMQARVIQHEMDHLEGVLFIDLLSPVARDRIKTRIQKHGFPKERRSRAFAL